MNIRENLYRAAISCGHEITKDQIILYADTRKEGNALSQLADRLEQSVKQLEQELVEAKALKKCPIEPVQDEACSLCMTGEGNCLAAQAQQPSIEDVQNLVDASKIMLEWCVKNIRQWSFSEYDRLHRATKKVEELLPPAPEGAAQAQQESFSRLRKVESIPTTGEFLIAVWEGDWGNVKQNLRFYHAHGYKNDPSWAKNYRTEEGEAYKIAGWMPLPPAPEGGEK